MCVSCREGQKKKRSHNDWHLFDPSLVCTGAPRLSLFLSFFLSACAFWLTRSSTVTSRSRIPPQLVGGVKDSVAQSARSNGWSRRSGDISRRKKRRSPRALLLSGAGGTKECQATKRRGLKGRTLLKGTGAEAAAVESPNTATF